MLSCLMMLTDIIEFYKCLKSLSGATTTALNKKIKGKEKVKRGKKRNNHSPKYSAGAKCLKKCSGKALER